MNRLRWHVFCRRRATAYMYCRYFTATNIMEGQSTYPVTLEAVAFAYGTCAKPVFEDVCVKIAPAARVVLVRFVICVQTA